MVGCGPTAEGVAEVQNQQQPREVISLLPMKILERLGDLDARL